MFDGRSSEELSHSVLNLIINGLPSKQKKERSEEYTTKDTVLNLIINGLPSKH